MQVIIGKRFKIIKKLSQGSFGEIYQSINIKTGQSLAIKLQKTSSKHPQLLFQSKILKNLLHDSSLTQKGIPNLHFSGTQGDYNILVMDLLGPNLQQLLQKCGGTFSIKTALMLMEQLIKRLQYVHLKGYLHRDVKPENFCMGSDAKAEKVYIIDFGLSKRYTNEDNNHLPYIQGRSISGTVRYVSINTHLGIQPTRRDDLESVIFITYYYLYGKLPWQGQSAATLKQKYDKILAKKIQYKPQTLFKNILPQIRAQLIQIFKHIRCLKYDQKPNYQLMKLKIRQCLKLLHFEYDYQYDWKILQQKDSKFKRSDSNYQSKKSLHQRKMTHQHVMPKILNTIIRNKRSESNYQMKNSPVSIYKNQKASMSKDKTYQNKNKQIKTVQNQLLKSLQMKLKLKI